MNPKAGPENGPLPNSGKYVCVEQQRIPTRQPATLEVHEGYDVRSGSSSGISRRACFSPGTENDDLLAVTGKELNAPKRPAAGSLRNEPGASSAV